MHELVITDFNFNKIFGCRMNNITTIYNIIIDIKNAGMEK